MNRDPGSMNRIFVWSDGTGGDLTVPDNASGRGKRSFGVAGALVAASLMLSALALGAGPPPVDALPTGGTVSAGQASIGQSGSQLTVNQSSQRAVIDWNSFNIGAQAQVEFKQPNAGSVALNRINAADGSAIFGRLTANGQVFLVNPNGIVFGAGSQVDATGIAASTLNIAAGDFMAGRLDFTRNGASGRVLNQGTLTAHEGGYVALLGTDVRNDGVINARLGSVVLAAGEAISLNIAGQTLFGIKVDPAAIDVLVANGEMIRAEGGQVILSVGAANRLLQ